MDVELAELEVIRRYSLVVGQPTADAAEVIAALRADLARLEGASTARSRPTPGLSTPAGVDTAPATSTTARRTPAARRRG